MSFDRFCRNVSATSAVQELRSSPFRAAAAAAAVVAAVFEVAGCAEGKRTFTDVGCYERTGIFRSCFFLVRWIPEPCLSTQRLRGERFYELERQRERSSEVIR